MSTSAHSTSSIFATIRSSRDHLGFCFWWVGSSIGMVISCRAEGVSLIPNGNSQISAIASNFCEQDHHVKSEQMHDSQLTQCGICIYIDTCFSHAYLTVRLKSARQSTMLLNSVRARRTFSHSRSSCLDPLQI